MKHLVVFLYRSIPDHDFATINGGLNLLVRCVVRKDFCEKIISVVRIVAVVYDAEFASVGIVHVIRSGIGRQLRLHAGLALRVGTHSGTVGVLQQTDGLLSIGLFSAGQALRDLAQDLNDTLERNCFA